MFNAENMTTQTRPDCPNRCQRVTGQGQCTNKGVALPDGTFSQYCAMHNGNVDLRNYKKESVRNYRLTKWHAELQRHATAPEVKGLRDEIGILRMVLEERLNRCTDSTDILLHSGAIGDMVLKIEKLVSSCHKLEGLMGQLLDKQAILQFAGEVIDIIGEECADSKIVEQIGNRIMLAIGRVGKTEEDDET